jgi:hypothetical protein
LWNQSEARYGIPDLARAAELAAKLERLAAARAAYHRQRYGTPNHGEVSLPDLGRADGLPATTRRWLRRQRMQQAVEVIERGMEFQ